MTIQTLDRLTVVPAIVDIPEMKAARLDMGDVCG